MTSPESFDFEGALIQLVPPLRAYARAVTRNRENADDLVQDTLLRALRSRHTFVPGTNLKAWTFTILRNQFITSARRKRPEQGIAPAEGDEIGMPASQEDTVALNDFHRILLQLPELQREALLLVGAEGFSYEEAAAVAGSTTGTMKSRVSRARAFLLPHFLAVAPTRGIPVSDMNRPAPKKRRQRRDGHAEPGAVHASEKRTAAVALN